MDVQLEQFSGPLDLLLGLIKDKKLEITTVSISRVTEQYLHYLEQIEEKNPEELADFLVIATKLLVLKSQELLPQFSVQEDEDEQNLVDQLRIYKAFVDVSKMINKQWLQPVQSFARCEPTRKPEGFVPPTNTTLDVMHKSMVTLLRRIAPPKALPKTHIDKTVSLKEKIISIRNFLKNRKTCFFFDVIDRQHNKTDVIVTFLALLELVKQKNIHIDQEDIFGDISITSIQH